MRAFRKVNPGESNAAFKCVFLDLFDRIGNIYGYQVFAPLECTIAYAYRADRQSKACYRRFPKRIIVYGKHSVLCSLFEFHDSKIGAIFKRIATYAKLIPVIADCPRNLYRSKTGICKCVWSYTDSARRKFYRSKLGSFECAERESIGISRNLKRNCRLSFGRSFELNRSNKFATIKGPSPYIAYGIRDNYLAAYRLSRNDYLFFNSVLGKVKDIVFGYVIAAFVYRDLTERATVHGVCAYCGNNVIFVIESGNHICRQNYVCKFFATTESIAERNAEIAFGLFAAHRSKRYVGKCGAIERKSAYAEYLCAATVFLVKVSYGTRYYSRSKRFTLRKRIATYSKQPFGKFYCLKRT